MRVKGIDRRTYGDHVAPRTLVGPTVAMLLAGLTLGTSQWLRQDAADQVLPADRCQEKALPR